MELVDERMFQNTNVNLEEAWQKMLRSMCGEPEPQNSKDIQTAVKALQSQKADGISPKQLGEGFKETVERYKDMDSLSEDEISDLEE